MTVLQPPVASAQLVDSNGLPTQAFYRFLQSMASQFTATAQQIAAVASVPTGAIATFPATVAPSGYLALAGQTVLRTAYPALWTFAQGSGQIVSDAVWSANNWGSFSTGDGSTTFRLPDFRGEFGRFLDNGRGVDPSRVAGAWENHAYLSHNHGATVTDPSHTHTAPDNRASVSDVGGGAYNGGGLTQGYAGSLTNPATTGITVGIAVSGGTETRPRNVTMLACIKT